MEFFLDVKIHNSEKTMALEFQSYTASAIGLWFDPHHSSKHRDTRRINFGTRIGKQEQHKQRTVLIYKTIYPKVESDGTEIVKDGFILKSAARSIFAAHDRGI